MSGGDLNGLALRDGGAADLAAVIALMQAAFDPRYGEAWTLGQTAGVLAMPGVSLLLAEKKRRLLGFALARTVLDECELMLLAVDPQARRLGVAARLLTTVITRGRAAGTRRLHLEVRKGNGAVRLYEAHGLQLVGERQRYYRGPTGEMFDAQTYSVQLDT